MPRRHPAFATLLISLLPLSLQAQPKEYDVDAVVELLNSGITPARVLTRVAEGCSAAVPTAADERRLREAGATDGIIRLLGNLPCRARAIPAMSTGVDGTYNMTVESSNLSINCIANHADDVSKPWRLTHTPGSRTGLLEFGVFVKDDAGDARVPIAFESDGFFRGKMKRSINLGLLAGSYETTLEVSFYDDTRTFRALINERYYTRSLLNRQTCTTEIRLIGRKAD